MCFLSVVYIPNTSAVYNRKYPFLQLFVVSLPHIPKQARDCNEKNEKDTPSRQKTKSSRRLEAVKDQGHSGKSSHGTGPADRSPRVDKDLCKHEKDPFGVISAIKLKRTDTTLDQSHFD